MAEAKTFSFRYGAFRVLLSLLGMGPSLSRIELDDNELKVRFGWAFRVSVPRGSIQSVSLDDGFVGGIGVHGWRGSWLVNGAATGLVRMSIDPPARAQASLFPVKLQALRLSVEDPNGLVAALN